MNDAIDWLTALFYGTDLWGYFGPVAWVLICAKFTKEEKNTGVFLYIVTLFMVGYFYLPNITTYYIQSFIMLFGGAITCIVPQLSR